MSKYRIILPSKLELEVSTLEGLDEETSKIIFTTVLGTLLGISKIKDESDRRIFYLKYAAILISEADSAIRSCQMANNMGEKSPEQIVDDLLKSIKHKSE
jgi:hypothetical protein